MIEWLLIGLLVGLTVGLALLCLSQRTTLKEKDTTIHSVLADVQSERALATKTQERMIEQLIMLRRDGFQTIPEDEPFDAYRITPEQEAQWEEDQIQGLGGVNPESLVEG